MGTMPESPGYAPDWPAPATVRAWQSTRRGGVSPAPYDSLNLGDHVADLPAHVAANRQRLHSALALPAAPCWLRQVHGTRVLEAGPGAVGAEADAVVLRRPGAVGAIMTADCLPVLFCDRQGSVAGAAHAGWRGLVAGILENTVVALGVPPRELLAWLGPAIGPTAFEVGEEVQAACLAAQPEAARAFLPGRPGKYLADLYALARLRLERAGVTAIYGGGRCTVNEAADFFSYRRDGTTGRMATLIWLDRAP